MSQRISSIVRQVAAVLVSVYGVLTASVTGMKLPVGVSLVLTAVGPVILGIEHYVGDPSTGTPATPPQVAQVPPQPVPAAPVAVAAPVAAQPVPAAPAPVPPPLVPPTA